MKVLVFSFISDWNRKFCVLSATACRIFHQGRVIGWGNLFYVFSVALISTHMFSVKMTEAPYNYLVQQVGKWLMLLLQFASKDRQRRFYSDLTKKKKKSRSYRFWSKDNFFLSSLFSFFPPWQGSWFKHQIRLSALK